MCLIYQPMVHECLPDSCAVHEEALCPIVWLARCPCVVDVQVSVSQSAPKPCLLSCPMLSLCKRQQAKIRQPFTGLAQSFEACMGVHVLEKVTSGWPALDNNHSGDQYTCKQLVARCCQLLWCGCCAVCSVTWHLLNLTCFDGFQIW